MFVIFILAILCISNCATVATCHPHGIVHWDPINEQSKKIKTLSINFT